MNRVRILLVSALAMASSAAMAFDVQQSGQVSGAPAAKSAPASENPLGADLSLSETKQPMSEGTEVRIPGLGKLGVLPKLDFGLELLYGATETKQPDTTPDQPADGVVVRGTVKHRF
ncbi:MAG: hypothetical protein DIU63_12925 [Proteobacteria bacterium]|jgi:hypothetical protein|nr:MAG: hypothetical protein DIU63_12925 [Pseudomonadota bacterium]